MLPLGDTLLVEGDQAAVGDGNAVGVARQIGEHGLGPTERPLCVDDPLRLALWRQKGCETPDIDVLERAIRDPRVTVLDRIYDGYEKEVSPRNSAIVRLLDPATTP